MVYGLPGAGKTYTLTRIALSYLRQGRVVLTDFPVLGCYRWDPLLLRMDCPYAVYDAVVILDEAYKYFNSRRYKDFSTRMHEFFSLHRHNGVTVYLGTQHPARLDVVIRELCDYYVAITNVSLWRPIWFAARYYDEDPCTWPTGQRPRPHHTRRYFFRRCVAAAYDTHQLRSTLPPIELRPWGSGSPAARRPLQDAAAARARAVWDRIVDRFRR